MITRMSLERTLVTEFNNAILFRAAALAGLDASLTGQLGGRSVALGGDQKARSS